MAVNVPAGLKPADITRFASRAAQLEKAKPTVAYWCNYWVVNQILSKGLHTTDADCMKYTTDLMDKLEKFKSDHSDDINVTSDEAGQQYVEDFGLETFQRADNAVQANKATLQTADTFQAAATFLDLCHIWGQPTADIAAKIKFAKYHAVRIVKAVKAGEDPNESNPPNGEVEEDVEGGQPSTIETTVASVTEEELRGRPDLEGSIEGRQPTFEDIPDRAGAVPQNMPLPPTLNASSRSSSAGPTRKMPPTSIPSAPTSQLPPSPPISGPDGMMDFESHLRQRPSHLSQATVPDLPAAPSDFPNSPASSSADIPNPLGAPPDALASLNSLRTFPTPGNQFPSADVPALRPPRPVSPDIDDERRKVIPPPVHAPKTVQQESYPRGAAGQVIDDDVILLAQKHARWAVSALNFDDTHTAISELRKALSYLGAS
ncbi:hypothetical protein FQN57_002008 [Myotisia sp. PD_48]|nr:hypothetical protein FQN57_002008 [Myotisia sp. PD_48]